MIEIKNLPRPLGLEKKTAVSLPSLRELKHHKSGKRLFVATLTVNAICSSDISISDFSPLPHCWNYNKMEHGPKEERDKRGLKRDRLRDPDPLSPLNWGQRRLYGGSNYHWLTTEPGDRPRGEVFGCMSRGREKSLGCLMILLNGTALLPPNLACCKLNHRSNVICFMELS